ncbi:hypothetical protein [Parachlamydia sp. AcF125]|uniref:hypothetical protein n=1 Tax=Parachlamydia sp. AcF125 TaxID=2795736 RepID=UPI001BCA1DE0|nr:hypothetical protein [Parachlamydia sp. AcF125]MBS4168109.1 hypothetical protein [Parachlamydia sp. AcF125]
MILGGLNSEYGFPAGWKPAVGNSSQNAMLDAFSAKVGTNAISTAQEMISNAKTLALHLPNVPMKAEILDFMKVISNALTQLQQEIYLIQNQAAIKSKDLGKAELDIHLNKLEKQKEELKSQSRSGKPGLGVFNSIMKFLDLISTVLSIAIAIFRMGVGAGLIGIDLVAAAIAYTLVDQVLIISGKRGV